MITFDNYTGGTPVKEDELDLLACCLTGYDPADVDIQPTEFDEPRNGEAWQAMTAVAQTGQPPNPTTVRVALGPKGDDAAYWLMEIFTRPVVPSNAPMLAERIRKAGYLRGLQDAARGLMRESSEPGADPNVVASRYRQALDMPDAAIKTTETYGDALPRVIDQIENGLAAGHTTPWPDLDKRIHGLAKDRLYIVAARPGVGKSLLGQNLAWHFSHKHGLPTYFASLEMSTDELTTRTIAQTAHVDMDDLLAGKVALDGWDRITRASTSLTDARVHICDTPGQTIDSIRNGARQLQRRRGLGLIVVDYLQLVTPRNLKVTREQQVSEVSRSLKLLAKELHVPIVAMSQVRRLNDNEQNRRPNLSDLRESGAIEQDADVVMILHIPSEKEPWDAELLVAKARAGQRGVVQLHMRTKWATIGNAESRHDWRASS